VRTCKKFTQNTEEKMKVSKKLLLISLALVLVGGTMFVAGCRKTTATAPADPKYPITISVFTQEARQ
jgi:hypothetical protein